MKDDEDGLAFFAKYIPMKVLESLTVEDIANLANAWRDASFVKDEVTMGE